MKDMFGNELKSGDTVAYLSPIWNSCSICKRRCIFIDETNSGKAVIIDTHYTEGEIMPNNFSKVFNDKLLKTVDDKKASKIAIKKAKEFVKDKKIRNLKTLTI